MFEFQKLSKKSASEIQTEKINFLKLVKNLLIPQATMLFKFIWIIVAGFGSYTNKHPDAAIF